MESKWMILMKNIGFQLQLHATYQAQVAAVSAKLRSLYQTVRTTRDWSRQRDIVAELSAEKLITAGELVLTGDVLARIETRRAEVSTSAAAMAVELALHKKNFYMALLNGNDRAARSAHERIVQVERGQIDMVTMPEENVKTTKAVIEVLAKDGSCVQQSMSSDNNESEMAVRISDIVARNYRFRCECLELAASLRIPRWTNTLPCAAPDCMKTGSLVCARCQKVGYCSRACQKTGWAEHKPRCQSE
jgi:hypothetical protein